MGDDTTGKLIKKLAPIMTIIVSVAGAVWFVSSCLAAMNIEVEKSKVRIDSVEKRLERMESRIEDIWTWLREDRREKK